MSVFFYTKKETFLHRLDPRVKLFLLAGFFLSAGFSKNIFPLFFLLCGILVLFFAAKSIESIRKMAVIFSIISVITFILWVIFSKEAGINKLFFASVMTLRFLTFLLAGLLFLSITSLEEFSSGLVLLGIPYPIAFAISLSFRLVIVFISTGFIIVEAQKVRGNNVEEGNLMKRINAYIPLLIPLILNGVKKVETLTLSLESKGFSPTNKINIKGRYKMTAADWTALIGMVIGFLILTR